MLRRRTAFWLAASSVGVVGGVTGLMACFSDPRANDTVTVIDQCDETKLSTANSSPQASLKAYLDSTDALLKEATDVESEMKDACNALDTDLGLPTGTDSASACKSVAGYVDNLVKQGTPPLGPGAPEWAELRYVPNCTPNPAGELEKCVSTCTATACDATKCEPGKLAGTCAGDCKGACVTTGPNVACTGGCVGEVTYPAGPPTTCHGVCTGTCTNPVWSAACDGACSGTFVGNCAGTCTGICNGQPINVQDAGPPADSGPPGDGGGGGGPPSSGPPPNNADGNCKGFCVGVCSSGSNGFCANAPCFTFPAGPPALAEFSGYCADRCGAGPTGTPGTCVAANGTGSEGATCNGTCTAPHQTQCTGQCQGGCSGPITNGVCLGSLKCDQNAECENACQARVALAASASCQLPTILEAYAVSDPKLAAAWKKDGPALGKAVTRLPYIRAALAYIGARAYGDFVSIGLSGDLVRACVAKGNATVASAQAKYSAALAADPSVHKIVSQ